MAKYPHILSNTDTHRSAISITINDFISFEMIFSNTLWVNESILERFDVIFVNQHLQYDFFLNRVNLMKKVSRCCKVISRWREEEQQEELILQRIQMSLESHAYLLLFCHPLKWQVFLACFETQIEVFVRSLKGRKEETIRRDLKRTKKIENSRCDSKRALELIFLKKKGKRLDSTTFPCGEMKNFSPLNAENLFA